MCSADRVEKKIQSHFILNGWTLSLAESCTGGALSARLTQVAGCSKYFLGSMVVYSNEMKIKVLGVDEKILMKKGAVSLEVVEQMSLGVKNLTGSDFTIAVSGIAGPSGGSVDKPVGTVWGAITTKENETVVWCFHHTGSREEIIQKTVDSLLEKLLFVAGIGNGAMQNY